MSLGSSTGQSHARNVIEVSEPLATTQVAGNVSKVHLVLHIINNSHLIVLSGWFVVLNKRFSYILIFKQSYEENVITMIIKVSLFGCCRTLTVICSSLTLLMFFKAFSFLDGGGGGDYWHHHVSL